MLAALIRAQLAFPDGKGVSSRGVPLMIGARDTAFPRRSAFGYWMFPFGGLLLYSSYIGGVGLAGRGTAPTSAGFDIRR